MNSSTTLQSPERKNAFAPISARPWLANLLWALPFLVLYWCDIARHQLWFDELNAWSITAASPNLATLARYVHYEGHPWLWYFVLWLPSRISTAPVAMKWVEVWIGTAIYLVIGLKSPFTRLEKVLIFLNYFVVFEYTVMSRMYGIMLLMVVLYAWRRVEKPNGVIGIAVLLGVMASTDMTGVLLSGALLLEYVYACWHDREPGAAGDATTRRQAAAALVYCGLLACSILSLLPAKDISWQSTGRLFSEAAHPAHLARCIVNVTAAPWWPINVEFPKRFWETDMRLQRKLEFLMPLVLLVYWHCFRRRRNLLLLMALTVSFGIFFADAVYIGRVRHWGITEISFLVALWLMRAEQNQQAGSGRKPRLPWSAYPLLALGVVAGLVAVSSSWAHPFSQSAKAAQWLRDHHLADGAVVGEPDVSFSSVAEQLQRPVYFLECACVDRFKLFSNDRLSYPIKELPDRLALAVNNLHTNQLIFFRWRKLEPDEVEELRKRSLSVTLLTVIDGADSWLENYHIYRISRMAPSVNDASAAPAADEAQERDR